MKYRGTLLLLLLLIGSLFATTAFAGPISPDSDHDDTNTSDPEDENEETDTEEEDKENDSDDDGIDDDTEEAYEREVEVEQADREWKIESKLKNGEQKDEFEVEFKIGGGDEPEIELEYSTETASNETEMKYRVNFDELIEFTDDSTPGYQEGNDTVVSIYELDKAEWNAIIYASGTLNGSTVHTATAQTSDGIFTLVLKISTGITQINNTVITPNAIKIDVIIDGYNYEGNNTYLTLQTDIKTESETEYEDESEDEENGFATDESQIRVSNTKASGFFSWVETAEADGTTISVLSTSHQEEDDDLEEGEHQNTVFFTFDTQNPDRIVWDPKVGISNNNLFNQNILDQINPEALSVSLWTFLAIFAIPILYRRRD